jgi:hypothetical protein
LMRANPGAVPLWSSGWWRSPSPSRVGAALAGSHPIDL